MLFGLIRMWLLGVLAIALWAGAVLLMRGWVHRLPDPRPVVVAVPNDDDRPPIVLPPPSFTERVGAWRPGLDTATACLAGAVALTLLGFGGGRALLWLFLPHGADEPDYHRPADVRRIRRPDGSELHVEVSGNPAGPTVILTHGWGLTAAEWFYLRRQLADRYRVVAWDLPGLGHSRGPTNHDFSLDKMAADLQAVLDDVGGPVVLIGHSIGGMVTLNFAKRFPAELGTRVVGLVLVHTTHTNPLVTMQGSWYLRPLQKPLLEPLAYLMIALSPVVWLMNAVSYLNGSLHHSTYRNTFSRTGTYGQVDFVCRFVLHLWPATYARGTLGMFGYHATDALATIPVPTLVVAADRDSVCMPSASRDIQAGVPQAEQVTLAPAGHMGLLSDHSQFGRSVEMFLDRCLGVTTHNPS